MGGYAYGEHEPTDRCPYCSTICRADFVDIGVGFQQCGPFHCEECGASEIGIFDEPRPLTAREEDTGWYAPGEAPGSSANVIAGKVVSHVEARRAYRDEFKGNQLWQDEKYVKNWWDKLRSTGEPR